MSDVPEPNWEGVGGRGEHRTTGVRAWCYLDSEWCWSYREGWCTCCDDTAVPERWRGENVGVVLADLRRQVESKRDAAQAIVDDIGLPAAYVAKIRALAFAEIVSLLEEGGSDE